jgi:NAD(P)-dependent dehydrogenase (short-subunit alcohol dehydrogenase family)
MASGASHLKANMKRIAVTGATGYIGGRLVPRLLEAGYAVRCLARSLRKLQDRGWWGHPNVQVMQADLGDAKTLAEALAGCEAVFFLVHSMNSASAEYARRDLQLATAFGRAAKKAGLRRARRNRCRTQRTSKVAAPGGESVGVHRRAGHSAAGRHDRRVRVGIV